MFDFKKPFSLIFVLSILMGGHQAHADDAKYVAAGTIFISVGLGISAAVLRLYSQKVTSYNCSATSDRLRCCRYNSAYTDQTCIYPTDSAKECSGAFSPYCMQSNYQTYRTTNNVVRQYNSATRNEEVREFSPELRSLGLTLGIVAAAIPVGVFMLYGLSKCCEPERLGVGGGLHVANEPTSTGPEIQMPSISADPASALAITMPTNP